MNITEKHIASKTRVGTLDGAPVIELTTTGGLSMIISSKGGVASPIGVGPHRAVARFIAQKKSAGKIQWSDLKKSDHVDPDHFADILPFYENMTKTLSDALSKAQK